MSLALDFTHFRSFFHISYVTDRDIQHSHAQQLNYILGIIRNAVQLKLESVKIDAEGFD